MYMNTALSVEYNLIIKTSVCPTKLVLFWFFTNSNKYTFHKLFHFYCEKQKKKIQLCLSKQFSFKSNFQISVKAF